MKMTTNLKIWSRLIEIANTVEYEDWIAENDKKFPQMTALFMTICLLENIKCGTPLCNYYVKCVWDKCKVKHPLAHLGELEKILCEFIN